MTALKAKTRAAVLQIAEWQLGVVEMPTNSNKVKYNSAYYGREVSGSGYAWCMAFVWWVFREAGFSLYKTASCSAFVQRYRTAAPAQMVTSGYKPGTLFSSTFPENGSGPFTSALWWALWAARSSLLRATPAPETMPTAAR